MRLTRPTAFTEKISRSAAGTFEEQPFVGAERGDPIGADYRPTTPAKGCPGTLPTRGHSFFTSYQVLPSFLERDVWYNANFVCGHRQRKLRETRRSKASAPGRLPSRSR